MLLMFLMHLATGILLTPTIPLERDSTGKPHVRELEHYLLGATEDNIGILALEEDIPKTALGIMSIEAEKQLHLNQTISEEEKKKLLG